MSNQPTQLQNNNNNNNNNVKLGTGAIALFILGGAMLITNPKQDEYVNYASVTLIEQIQKECQGDLCGFINPLIALGKPAIKPALDLSTKRQNFVLFSIYTTELPGKTYKTLGLFGNFIPVQF